MDSGIWHEFMKKRRMRSGWIIFAIIAIGILIGGGCWVVFAGRAKPIPPEKLAKVERGDIARSVVAIGKIEPLSKVEVKSKANGILKVLRVDEGDTVVEGQVLAELDKENLEAQVREAEATLKGEEANLQAAMTVEVKARIEAAGPELEFARRDHARMMSLFAQKIASQQQLDDAERAFETARNRRELQEAAVSSAVALIEQARARVAAAKAALDRAEENLRYATLRAPITGIVLTRNTEVGDAVSSILNLGSAATLIMTLGDVSSVFIKGDVDEADIGKIQVGLPVRTRVESFRNEVFQGTIQRLSPMGRQQNNVTTFEVRVSISNTEGKLRVNMTANAEIVLEERKRVLLIPESALIYEPDRTTWVQRHDATNQTGWRKIPIKTGIANGQRCEIIEGLSDGDRVVLP